MKPKIFLHVGLNKTGSASIQKTLFTQRDVLKKYDIDYLDLRANHSRTFCTLFKEHPENYLPNKRGGIDTPEKVIEFN